MHDMDHDNLRYQVRLLIRHPSINPELITEILGLKPHMSHMAGRARVTPTGTKIAGTYEESTWSYLLHRNSMRYFFEDVVAIVNTIAPAHEFLSQISETEGSIRIIVDLFGDVNIGDEMPWIELEKLTKLKINLGIEVFPV